MRKGYGLLGVSSWGRFVVGLAMAVMIGGLILGASAPVSATETQVNTYTADDQGRSSVAMDAGGNFVIAWHSYLQDGNYRGIYAQRYDSSGNRWVSGWHCCHHAPLRTVHESFPSHSSSLS